MTRGGDVTARSGSAAVPPLRFLFVSTHRRERRAFLQPPPRPPLPLTPGSTAGGGDAAPGLSGAESRAVSGRMPLTPVSESEQAPVSLTSFVVGSRV